MYALPVFPPTKMDGFDVSTSCHSGLSPFTEGTESSPGPIGNKPLKAALVRNATIARSCCGSKISDFLNDLKARTGILRSPKLFLSLSLSSYPLSGRGFKVSGGRKRCWARSLRTGSAETPRKDDMMISSYTQDLSHSHSHPCVDGNHFHSVRSLSHLKLFGLV